MVVCAVSSRVAMVARYVVVPVAGGGATHHLQRGFTIGGSCPGALRRERQVSDSARASARSRGRRRSGRADATTRLRSCPAVDHRRSQTQADFWNPTGSGPVSETERYTRGTGVVTPLDTWPALTRWMWAGVRCAPAVPVIPGWWATLGWVCCVQSGRPW